MKKKSCLFASVAFVVFCALGFTACGGSDHDHLWAQGWSDSETHHWHACTVEGCTEKNDYAAHDYVDGVCVCGRTDPAQSGHDHIWAQTWSEDETHHWHACTVEGCTAKNDNAPHVFDQSGNCVCQKHRHVFSERWTREGDYHWRAAICEHSEEKADYGEHDFTNGDCVCGKQKPTVGTAGLLYSLDQETGWSTYYVYGIGTATETEIEIASEYEGKPVTGIRYEAFKDQTQLVSVKIPDSIVKIGYSAFSGCTSLESVKIPYSVTALGSNLFSNCTSLQTVELSEGLERIENNVFYGCSALREIEIPDSVNNISSSVFERCSSLENIVLPEGVTRLPTTLFAFCPKLTNVTIPESVTYIGERVFQNSPLLKEVTIPDGVGEVDRFAFQDSSIETLRLPASACSAVGTSFKGQSAATRLKTVIVTSGDRIGANAFDGCKGLVNVTLADSITEIGKDAFLNCPVENASMSAAAFSTFGIEATLKVVTVTSGEKIEDYTFGNGGSKCKITKVVLGDSVRTIGQGAFALCYDLEEVVFSKNLKSIGREAFCVCSSLENLNLPESLETIGEGAFDRCSTLKTVKIPEKVQTIGASAFSGCTALTSVHVPASVTTIGTNAFCDCAALNGVYIRDLAAWCGISFGEGESISGNLESNPLYHAHNLYLNDALMTEFALPAEVTTIKDLSFAGLAIQSLRIPEQIRSVGSRAFYGSSVKNVTFAEGTREIGDAAFSECKSLETVLLPDTLERVGNSLISGADTFRFNKDGRASYIGSEGNPYFFFVGVNVPSDGSMTSFELHEDTEILGYNSIYWTRTLSTLTIPAGIRYISEEAIHLTYDLKYFNFKGTEAQWNAIPKHEKWLNTDFYDESHIVWTFQDDAA